MFLKRESFRQTGSTINRVSEQRWCSLHVSSARISVLSQRAVCSVLLCIKRLLTSITLRLRLHWDTTYCRLDETNLSKVCLCFLISLCLSMRGGTADCAKQFAHNFLHSLLPLFFPITRAIFLFLKPRMLLPSTTDSPRVSARNLFTTRCDNLSGSCKYLSGK
jgi:hypothetical protein